jgi:hypothetical protein
MSSFKPATVESILDAHDAEREALIAFYELDELPMKALRLRQGEPFDYLDLRALDALRAAAEKLAA